MSGEVEKFFGMWIWIPCQFVLVTLIVVLAVCNLKSVFPGHCLFDTSKSYRFVLSCV